MANPYSKYTGSRISPVPAGYLAAAQASAEGVRKSGEKFGDMIGAGIAKYYEGKEEARGQEAWDSYKKNRGYSTEEGRPEEPSAPATAAMDGDSEEVLRLREEKYRTISDAVAQKESAQPYDEAGVIKSVDAYKAAMAAQESDRELSGAPTQGEATPAERYIPTLNERLEAGNAALLGTLDKYGDRISGKKKKEIFADHERWIDRTTNQFNADRTHALQKSEQGLRRGALDQKGELAAREAADERSDMNALYGVIESQGLVTGKALSALRGAKTLSGMEKAYNAMAEADKDNMPAQVKTWMYLKTQLESQGRTPEEVRESQDIYFGGAQPTANERDIDLWNKIQADPNRSIEDKIHLGYILGAHTKGLIGDAYNKFIEDNPDATQKESLTYARKIGYVGLFDDEQSSMRLEKDRMELTRTKEAFKRWEEDPSKYHVIQTSIPGVQLLQAPGESHWTPFNTGASGKVVRLSSPEEAKEQNDWMVNNDINHVWVPDITGPKGTHKLVTKNPLNLREAAIKGKLPKPGEPSDMTPAPEVGEPRQPAPPAENPSEPPAPEGARPIEGATISGDGKSVTAGDKTIPVGGTFQQGETTYRVFVGKDGKAYYEKVK
jgi:hypothetical protein